MSHVCLLAMRKERMTLRPGLMGKLYAEANIFRHMHAYTRFAYPSYASWELIQSSARNREHEKESRMLA